MFKVLSFVLFILIIHMLYKIKIKDVLQVLN